MLDKLLLAFGIKKAADCYAENVDWCESADKGEM